LAFRIGLVWRSPEKPLLFTSVFSLLYLSPLLLGHLTHLSTLRAYQRERWKRARELVLREEAATQREVARRLAEFPEPAPAHVHVVRVAHEDAP
jgi:hypothetical protein